MNYLRPQAWLAALCLLSACSTSSTQPAADPEPTSPYADVEGVEMLSLADGSQVIWLKDNEGEKNNPRDLFADAPDALIDSLGLADGMPASISTFLLRTEGHNVLFDAGLGPKMGGHMAQRLAAIGLTPDSIDILCLTHLHTDHIGGMMGDEGPVFRNAQVYLGQVEYDAWVNQMPAEKAGLQQAMAQMYHDQLHLFAFADTLPCGIVAIDAVGHTPGHTVFQKGELLVIGDLMHGLALQQEHPEYNSNYDMDKAQSVASRKRILDYARTQGLVMAGMHLPDPGFCRPNSNL